MDILSFDNTCNYQKYLSGGNNNICTVSFQIKFFHALLYRHTSERFSGWYEFGVST